VSDDGAVAVDHHGGQDAGHAAPFRS
jgi:hypothetical protein